MRHFGCHATCKAYTEWATWKRQESIHTNKAKSSLNDMYDYGGKWRRCTYIGRTKR